MEKIEHSQESFITFEDIENLGHILKNDFRNNKIGKKLGEKLVEGKYEICHFEFDREKIIYKIEIDFGKDGILNFSFPIKKNFSSLKNQQVYFSKKGIPILFCGNSKNIAIWIKNISEKLFIEDLDDIFEQDLPF